MADEHRIDEMLEEAIEKRYFPSAVCVIGDADSVFYKKCFGWRRVFEDDAPCLDKYPAVIPDTAVKADPDTMYDMASLSKLISPTMIALRFIEDGRITLRDTLPMFFDNVPPEKQAIDIFRLMTHTSGITAHFALYNENPAIESMSLREGAERVIAYPLKRPIGEEVEYTCMGYIVLGAILEIVGGDTLDNLAKKYVFDPLGMSRTCYNPLLHGETNIAATEYRADKKKYDFGYVHDENAKYLRGVSGNAGVFSCADDLIKFAMMLSRHGDNYLCRSTFDMAIKNYTPGKADDRGLGFQLKSEEFSTMGDIYSMGSYGHNGYTGTSLYVDAATGRYLILLTNRVHYTRQSDTLYPFRRRMHNAAVSFR